MALSLHHGGHDVLLTSSSWLYDQKLADLGRHWITAHVELPNLSQLKKRQWCCGRPVLCKLVDLVHPFSINRAARLSAVAGWAIC